MARGGIEVERHVASVAGIMSASEFTSLELTANTKKVGRSWGGAGEGGG